MAHAYTPGLKVTENERLRRRRILPIPGEVVVEEGAKLQPHQVVARTFLPGKVEIVNVANKMGVDQSDVPGAMLKKEGDPVGRGEVIAEAKSLFGLLTSRATATLEGTVESISGVTGQVVLRGPPQPIEVDAYIEGRVLEVVPDQGVVVESRGTLIQGIFGIGGETTGEIAMVSSSPREVLDEDSLSADLQGRVVVGGSLVTGAALERAVQLGIRGVVAGGFDDQDLRRFLGHDLGVAITGHENLGVTLIVTEGFGRIDMAPRTYGLLKRHQGQRASINGATQIRAGVIRPEVIIPLQGSAPRSPDRPREQGMDVGSTVRIIRNPWFGRLGRVAFLPSEPARLDSGSRARVVSVRVEGLEEPVSVPRANVEIIEGRD
ncbi:MAG: hypothetical protein OXG44_07905 [Gammaproteobacteria bacterium]|nr:hypothetical protein [Gammaproteobacteria bacterium]